MSVSSVAAKPTCVVADDHPPVLESVTRYLAAQGLRVVGRAGDGDEALALIEAQRPDVAVLDLRMPGLPGAAVIRRVARTTPQSACLVYSGFGDAAILNEVLDAGARGYVLKDAPLEEIVASLRAAVAGDAWLSPRVAGSLLARVRTDDGAPQEGPAPPEALSARERDVLRLVAAGSDNAAIGRELHLSAGTVRKHVSRILAKLGVENRVEAAVYAVRNGLA